MTPAEKARSLEAAETAIALDPAQIDEVKRTLQSEGKACPQVVGLHPREAEDKMEVICIETTNNRDTHQ